MRLHRDGTIDEVETRVTRFAYPDKFVSIGGVHPTVEVGVRIDGEFERVVEISQNHRTSFEVMTLPVPQALRLARAIIRAAQRAKKEQRHMERKQEATR